MLPILTKNPKLNVAYAWSHVNDFKTKTETMENDCSKRSLTYGDANAKLQFVNIKATSTVRIIFWGQLVLQYQYESTASHKLLFQKANMVFQLKPFRPIRLA